MARGSQPVIVARFSHELPASALVQQLREHGIHAQTSGEFVAGFRAEVPGTVDVLVPASQAAAARELVPATGANSPRPEEPDAAADGSRNVPLIALLALAGSLLLIGVLGQIWFR